MSARTAETFRDLRTAPKVVCDLNSLAVTVQVNSDELAGVSLLNSIIQIALLERPPKLPPSHIENKQEKIRFFNSQTKAKAGELVAIILKIDTPLSSTFS